MQIFKGESNYAIPQGSAAASVNAGSASGGGAKPAAPSVRDFDAYQARLIGKAGLSIARTLMCVRYKSSRKITEAPPLARAGQACPASARASAEAGRVEGDGRSTLPGGGHPSSPSQEPAAPAAASWAAPARDASYWTFSGGTAFATPALTERHTELFPTDLMPCHETPASHAAGEAPQAEAAARGQEEEQTALVLRLRATTREVVVPPGPQRPQPEPVRAMEPPAMEPVTELAVDLLLDRQSLVTVAPGYSRPDPQPMRLGAHDPDDLPTHAGFEAPVSIGPRSDSKTTPPPFDLAAVDPRARSLLEAIKVIINRDDSIRHPGREMHVKHIDIGKLLTSALRGEGGYAIDDAMVRDVLLLVARDGGIEDAMRMHLFHQVIRPSIGLTRCLSLESLQSVTAHLRAGQEVWKDTLEFGRVVSYLYDVHQDLLQANPKALARETAAFGALPSQARSRERAEALRDALRIWITPALDRAGARREARVSHSARRSPSPSASASASGLRSPTPGAARPAGVPAPAVGSADRGRRLSTGSLGAVGSVRRSSTPSSDVRRSQDPMHLPSAAPRRASLVPTAKP